ncbi:MAG: adaptor protein MecA [Lachnospiraceae bacterium]|nr:adaptor protein MecA [Lachnospiraceae bacterium]
MRIEKVNDNQIRCTLTKEDLVNRKIKISELAYGSDKAKTLFRDMMQQASFEFGFEAENIPLMIEAIPVSNECIVLIITKVDDPEELDTRFSKFSPSVHQEASSPLSDLIENLSEGADDVLDLFKKLQSINNSATQETSAHELSEEEAKEAAKSSFKSEIKKKIKDASDTMAMVRIYGFDDLSIIIKLSKIITNFYHGSNSLFKDQNNGYLLAITKSDHSPADFNRVCNILAEYGNCIKSVSGSDAYLAEHHTPIIRGNALQTLSEV